MLAPGIFPAAMKAAGGPPIYFEAAAVIVVLVLLGQVLELRARERTGAAIRALFLLSLAGILGILITVTNLINPDEIFAIAVSIEKNAVLFYTKAALLQAKERESVKTLLNSLAAVEERHLQIVSAMRSNFSRMPDTGTLNIEGGLFLSAIASGYRIEGSPSEAEALTGHETALEMLRQGMELEKQSILFYLGLKDILASSEATTAIESIINEEKSHLAVLAEQVNAFGAE